MVGASKTAMTLRRSDAGRWTVRRNEAVDLLEWRWLGEHGPERIQAAEAEPFSFRTERMLAESGESGLGRRSPGALRAERTPHFAWSFSLLQNVDKKYGLLGGEGRI